MQQFAQNALPEMQQQAYGQQVVQQLPPEYQGQMDPSDPQGMAQGLRQRGQQDPNMLQQVWNNPIGKIAAVGIAGFQGGAQSPLHAARVRVRDGYPLAHAQSTPQLQRGSI